MSALTWILLALALLGAGHVSAQTLEESECRLERPGSDSVLARCSTLTVPEDPDRPDGQTIELAVARIPAQAAVPMPDPLVLIQGGPGGSSIDLYMQLRGAFAGIRQRRDIIVMDQRGTGRSAAGFACETPEDVDIETAGPELVAELVRDCLATIERDPRFYTTSVAVRDLDALRRAVGVEAWNVYGVSYGTRVAQQYLRRYPERTRSVILDGSVPADTILGPEIADAAQQALDAIFTRCAEDRNCAARFPNLPAKFAELRKRFAAGDVRVTQANPRSGELEEIPIVDGALLGLTRLMSYSSATAALLPLTIDEAYAGHYDTLLMQTQLVFGDVDKAMGFPMHNSVVCSEDYPRIDDPAREFGAGTYLGSTIMEALATICAQWPVGVVDPDFSAPLVSDTPVLLLSGSDDPATPARYADQIIAAGLSRARHIVVRDQGHGVVAIGCVPRLVERFIDAASVDGLAADCVNRELPTPFFLSPAGPAP
jgi:pimeloyl-ACP methyl ester carboxylesterase